MGLGKWLNCYAHHGNVNTYFWVLTIQIKEKKTNKQKLGMVAQVFNERAGEVETGGFQDLVVQSMILVKWRSCQEKRKVHIDWEKHTISYTRICGHMDITYNTSTHSHTYLPHFFNVHRNRLTAKWRMNGIGVLYYFIAHVCSSVAI